MENSIRSKWPWVSGALAACALAWAAIIFWMLTSSDPPGYRTEFWGIPSGWRTGIAHFALFAVLAGLLAMAILTNKALRRHFVRGVVAAVLVSATYGGALEMYQWVLPGRTATWGDAFINTVGAMAGAYSGAMVVRLLFAWRS
jgi:hypothetical protein